MTEMQKWRFKNHWYKWSVAYVTTGFLVFSVLMIALEHRGIIQYSSEKYFLTFLVKTFIIYTNEINGKIK